MKGKTSFVVGLIVCSLSTASATIINNTAPTSWLRSDPGTTYQAWGFDNGNSPADLDINLNPFGTPTGTVYGIDLPAPPPAPPPKTFWNDTHLGHQGVWTLYNGADDYIQFYIPNNPVPNPQKKIWFQMTYYASGTLGAEPQFFLWPSENVTVDLVSKVQVDENYYFHAIWEITMEPNPDEEWVTLQPRDCTLYIDEIVIDTICIPEPASLVLLVGTSGLIALIRRRFIA